MKNHLEIILKKMCKAVKADYDKINFSKSNWFHQYEWTEKQQNKFVEWLADYFFKTKEAREVILRFPRKTKKYVLEAAKEFVWNYGWKLSK